METFDIIVLLLILVPGIWTGLRKGFIYQVVTLAALVLGTWLSFTFAETLAQKLTEWVGGSYIFLRVLAFILIFFGVYFVLYTLSQLLLKVVGAVFGTWIDKVLGIVLASAKGVLAACILTFVFNSINSTFHIVEPETVDASLTYNIFCKINDWIWLRFFS